MQALGCSCKLNLGTECNRSHCHYFLLKNMLELVVENKYKEYMDIEHTYSRCRLNYHYYNLELAELNNYIKCKGTAHSYIHHYYCRTLYCRLLLPLGLGQITEKMPQVQ